MNSQELPVYSQSVSISLRDGDHRSPVLYCTWGGYSALKTAQDVCNQMMRVSVHSIMCNLIARLMDGDSLAQSYYLFNTGSEPQLDKGLGHWTYDVVRKEWESPMGFTSTAEISNLSTKGGRTSCMEDCI